MYAMVTDDETIESLQEDIVGQIASDIGITKPSDACVYESEHAYESRDLPLSPATAIGPRAKSCATRFVVSVPYRTAKARLQKFLIKNLLVDASPMASGAKYEKFKKRLCELYNCSAPDDHVRCMVLNQTLPSSLVVATHLIRQDVKPSVVKLMRLEGIDDESNGLLLFLPIKAAYERFQLGFFFDRGKRQLRVMIFDLALPSRRLVDELTEQQRALLLQTTTHDAGPGSDFDMQTTFGDIENRLIAYTSNGRAYPRCLNVHYAVAVAHTVYKG
ncbi:hypothetical protein Poli38472_005597 [Pythium oligandrum]|uniref:HNH nuclease domain-containing protein n=1 Tax=Pythium oligandrum TaxID=41045 RepID=A0A8K1CG99_PYTOL|nr:hypothetical protein Poli38472_005597 [Pythium oligandrum]|eukprot:TMW62979.1 hypothetical protein Poli38472_005597 [Pythium oligandrum]